MINKKNLLVCLLSILLLFTVCMTACGDNGNEEGKQGSSIAGLVNGFDSIEDLYSIKFNVGTDYPADYRGEINKDKQFIKDGEGSLKITYYSGGHPEPIIYCSNIKDLNLTDLKSCTCYVYNDTVYDFDVNFNLLRKEGISKKNAMYSMEYKIEPKKWTLLELPINNIVMQYNGNNVLGFGVEFSCRVPNDANEPQVPFVFYLDTFVLNYGAELSAEDASYKAQIDNVIDKINKIPNGISVNTESQLREIYDLYSELPDIYKGAITNYSTYSDAVKKLTNEFYSALESEEESPVLFTDKFFGQNHFTLAPTYNTTAKVGYTENVYHGSETGSTVFKFDGQSVSPWAAWNFTVGVPLSEYDVIKFYVKNETNKDAIMFFTWSNNRTIAQGDWVEIEIPTSAFGINFNELEITGVGQETLTGNLYISAINCYSLGIDGLYENAISSYGIEGCSINELSGITTFTAQSDTTTIALNKTRDNTNRVLNAYANIYVDKYFTMKVLDDAKSELYSVPLNRGWNTVSFVSSTHDFTNVKYLQFETQNGDNIKFKDFIIGLNSRDGILTEYMLYSWVPKGALTKSDLINVITFLQGYYKMTESNQKTLKNEISTIETDVQTILSNFATAYKNLIDEVDGNFVYEDATIINNVYKAYQDIGKLTVLNNSYIAKIEGIIEQWSNAPYKAYDFSTATGREAISIDMFSTQEQDPYTTMHDDDPSYNVFSEYVDGEYGSVVQLENPIYSGVGVKLNFHSNCEATENLKSVISGFDYVVFYLYNPLSDAYEVNARISNCNWGLTYLTNVRLEKGWNLLSVSATDFESALNDASYLYIYSKKNGINDDGNTRFFNYDTNETIKISSLYLYIETGYNALISEYEINKAQKEQAKIQSVIDSISNLPQIETIDSKSAIIDDEILSIKAQYELYGNKITNYNDLLSFSEKYEKLPYIVLSAKTENNKLSAEKRHQNDIAAETYDTTMSFDINYVADSVYGDVMEISNASHDGAFIRINIHTGLTNAREYWTKQLKNVTKVYFYVYNPSLLDARMIIMQGDWCVLADGTPRKCDYTLKNGWNLISIDKEVFLDSTNIDNRTVYYHGDPNNEVSSDCGYYLAFFDDMHSLCKYGSNIKISSFYGLEAGETVPETPTINKCQVTFDSNGGSAVASQSVVKGGKITKPTNPTKSGSTATSVIVFDGWYNGDTKWDFDNDTVLTDITLTAKWRTESYSEPIPIN